MIAQVMQHPCFHHDKRAPLLEPPFVRMAPEVRFEASARGIRNRSGSAFASSLQTLALARRSRTRVSSALISKGPIAGAPFVRMVPEVRFELTRYRYRRILSPLRLPFRHSGIKSRAGLWYHIGSHLVVRFPTRRACEPVVMNRAPEIPQANIRPRNRYARFSEMHARRIRVPR